MISLIRKYRISIIGIVVGAVAGYLYYHFLGCYNGTCTLKSSPIIMPFYGALMGYFLFSLFQREEKTSNK